MLITVLGTLAAAFFLLWLAMNGYVFLLPGLLIAALAIGIFIHKGSRTPKRLANTEIPFSLGIAVVTWTFIRGVMALSATVDDSLKSLRLEYGPLAGGAFALGLLGISIVTYRIFDKQHARLNSEWTALMQDPARRKIEDEKRQLEHRIREIEDMAHHSAQPEKPQKSA